MTQNKQHDTNKFKTGAGTSPGLEALHKIKSTTLTRADLAQAIHLETGIPKSETALLVERTLELMAAAIMSGENVKISGFGSFIIRHKSSRVGRNPKTGVEATISERDVLTFRPSTTLREKVNPTASDGDDQGQSKKDQVSVNRFPSTIDRR